MRRKRSIPKKAVIEKTQYRVDMVRRFDRYGQHGEMNPNTKRIAVARNVQYLPKHRIARISPAEQWETYVHELVHAVLNEMGRHELNNERFVERFARLLAPNL